MIDYKNIFYMAAQDGVLYCIIFLLLLLLLLLLLSIHPEITSLHARTHGGHSARAMPCDGWLVPGEEPDINQTRDR
jgi:hypothetical protein